MSLHLSGSSAKGTAKAESDIDVLVVYEESFREVVLDSISQIAFDVVRSTGRFIQPIIMTRENSSRELALSLPMGSVGQRAGFVFSSGCYGVEAQV